MAYTQNPGRGNNPKTGHGIPTPFMQTVDGPKTASMKAQVGKREGKETYDQAKKATEFAKGAKGTSLMEGTQMSKTTGETAAKPYEKKLVTQPSGDVFVVNSSGKTIASAKANKFNSTAVDALKKKYASEKSSTEDARTANATAQNASGRLGGGFTRKN